ncbi:MAG: o-succinylbenzoate synthase [Bacteroidota bacterium]
MALRSRYYKYKLKFNFDAGTSRGMLKEKHTYFLKVWDTANPEIFGLGEAGPLVGLSVDDRDDFEPKLSEVCSQLEQFDLQAFNNEYQSIVSKLAGSGFPAIRFALETALMDMVNGGERIIYPNAFKDSTFTIPINGLVWMGDIDFMLEQIDKKIKQGFDCIKVKIGALNFDEELSVLAHIRDNFTPEQITLRVDANGAFSVEEAPSKLEKLASYDIHSIEQPIQPGQDEAMRSLCDSQILPIALDEELIGIDDPNAKSELLSKINPQYIILKPTLVGGLSASSEWINTAEDQGIGWWITSALESNIGLNAISQYTALANVDMPQGLGTGQIYQNNISSPLQIHNGNLVYNQKSEWDLSPVFG